MANSTSPDKRWSFFRRARYLIILYGIPLFIRLYFRLTVNNSKVGNTYSEGEGVIFCSNHQSHLDALIVGASVAKPVATNGTRRFVAFMGNGKVMRENLIFSLTFWCGGFPIYRENPSPALAHSAKILNEGFCVFMSPQGMRVGTSPVDDYFNLTNNPRSGVGRVTLLANGKIPVVPMYIHGAGAALGGGRLVPRFKSFISVSFGDPMSFEKYTREKGWKEEDPDFFPTAKEISIEIMDLIHNIMMEQEKNYFTIIEKKFGKSIADIDEKFRADRSFRRYQRNLCNYSPEELKNELQKYSGK
ncbi:MAG: lysophospholipid acyltransferase family protein [Candidatus Hodarchaeales archaeon]